MTNDPIVITAAKRTPIGHFQGIFKNISAIQLGAAAIRACLAESTKLAPESVSEVIMGCVLPAGLGQAPARQAALMAGLPNSVGALTINKVCGSGLKAVMLAADLIKIGTDQIVIAGGMESMSNAPYLLPQARQGYRLGHHIVADHMLVDGLEDAYDRGKSMGLFAEMCASHYGFSREQQDQFALTSLKQAQAASANGRFTAEITPIVVSNRSGDTQIAADEGPLTAKPEKIPHLKPAFLKDGTVTAANSSSISDGAAALILMSQTLAQQQGQSILATIVGHAAHAHDPSWFTTAPTGAIKNLLSKINWTLDEVDLFEINEAFAVVPMATRQDLNIPAHKINIHGGACVLGHPIGASGARILVTLIYALRQNHLKKGIAVLCLGGGEAVAVAITV